MRQRAETAAFDRFVAACDKANVPNEAMFQAAIFTKECGFTSALPFA
jgi:hypothetical protein